MALADYDNDGDVDAVVTAIGQPLALLENRGAGGQWITIDAGTVAPGLRASVELSDGSVIERQVTTGGSWLSSEDPRLSIGFDEDLTIERVVVTSAAGLVEVFENVGSGTTVAGFPKSTNDHVVSAATTEGGSWPIPRPARCPFRHRRPNISGKERARERC